MKLIYVLFFVSICTSLRFSDMDLEALDVMDLNDLDLKSFYNAPASKLKVVIVKLDELIKHAQDHETVLVSNVSKYRIAYLKKKSEHERAVVKDLLATHEAGLAKVDEGKLRVAQELAKQHYDTAKTIRSGADTASTLAALHTVRSIIAKLLTGTHYPTVSPTKAPTHRPTQGPTKWVAPTPPTKAPTKAPTKSNLVYSSGSKILTFTGKNQISIPSSKSNTFTNDYSILVWVFPTSRTGDWARLIGKGSSSRRNYGLWLHGAGNPLSQMSCISAGSNIYLSAAADRIPLNRWTHLAMTFKKGVVHRLYVNGVMRKQLKTTGTPCTDSSPLTLGRASFHTGFIGKLKGVRIFNKFLTTSEIVAIKGQSP